MKPSRELDTLIAEKAFNWLIVEREKARGYPEFVARDIAKGEPRGMAARMQDVPPFSTEITCASDLRDHMERVLPHCVVSTHELDEKPYVLIDCDYGQFESAGETEAHALCLAALKVLDREE